MQGEKDMAGSVEFPTQAMARFAGEIASALRGNPIAGESAAVSVSGGMTAVVAACDGEYEVALSLRRALHGVRMQAIRVFPDGMRSLVLPDASIRHVGGIGRSMETRIGLGDEQLYDASDSGDAVVAASDAAMLMSEDVDARMSAGEPGNASNGAWSVSPLDAEWASLRERFAMRVRDGLVDGDVSVRFDGSGLPGRAGMWLRVTAGDRATSRSQEYAIWLGCFGGHEGGRALRAKAYLADEDGCVTEAVMGACSQSAVGGADVYGCDGLADAMLGRVSMHFGRLMGARADYGRGSGGAPIGAETFDAVEGILADDVGLRGFKPSPTADGGRMWAFDAGSREVAAAPAAPFGLRLVASDRYGDEQDGVLRVRRPVFDAEPLPNGGSGIGIEAFCGLERKMAYAGAESARHIANEVALAVRRMRAAEEENGAEYTYIRR